MATKAAAWMYADKHEDAPFHDGTFESWSKDRSASHPFHYGDGVRIWVSREDLTPDDLFI